MRYMRTGTCMRGVTRTPILLALNYHLVSFVFQCSLIIPRLEGLSLQGLLNFFNVPRKNPSPSFSLSQANMAQFTYTLSLTPPPPGWTRNPSSVYVIRDMIRWTTHIYLQQMSVSSVFLTE